jgi:hypothetical protein
LFWKLLPHSIAASHLRMNHRELLLHRAYVHYRSGRHTKEEGSFSRSEEMRKCSDKTRHPSSDAILNFKGANMYEIRDAGSLFLDVEAYFAMYVCVSARKARLATTVLHRQLTGCDSKMSSGLARTKIISTISPTATSLLPALEWLSIRTRSIVRKL